MNEIDRLFEKYAKPMDIGYEDLVKILVKSDFRQAMTEYDKKLRQAMSDRLHKMAGQNMLVPAKVFDMIINNTKLEEQG